MEDSDILPLIQWKEKGTRPSWQDVAALSGNVKSLWSQWQRLDMKGGVLYWRWESPGGKNLRWQVVLPSPLRKQVFSELHDSKLAGHMGVRRTLERLRLRCYWPRMHVQVERWCKMCRVCAARKNPPRSPRAPLQVCNVGAPMERVEMNIPGPLPVSNRGNKYILVVGDYFSKWTEGYAIPNQEAATVAIVFVEEFVCRYGVPLQVHTDEGRNFEAELFQQMGKHLGADKTRTTAFHPQSDGMIERLNRTMEDLLAKTVSDNQKDWDECLPFVMMAYRSSTHESTGFSPTELMMGREVSLPIDLIVVGSSRGDRNYSP